jgi:hypothetical protein
VDVWTLLQRFAAGERIAQLTSYQALARLFAEQCEIAVDIESREEKIALRESKTVASDSMQSPADPDAAYGHKGKGYEAQVAETCGGEEGELRVITHIDVSPSNGSDHNEAIPIIEQLAEEGVKPVEMKADGGYVSGGNIVEAAELGVDLQGPVNGADAYEDRLNLGDFIYDAGGEMTQCPGGAAPDYQEPAQSGDMMNAYFDIEKCRGCDNREKCVGAEMKKYRRIPYSAAKVATARRQREQKTAGFKKAYKKRSGIEGTNSELKRAYGMGNLRVRGRPKVRFVLKMIGAACNLKRYFKYALKKAAEKTTIEAVTA